MPNPRQSSSLLRFSALLLFILMLAVWGWIALPAQAAPYNQTVPIPTPTSEIAVPVATATPSNSQSSGSGSDNGAGAGQTGASGGMMQLPTGGTVVNAQIGPADAQLYEGPGTSYALLGVLSAGTPVELFGRDTGLAWYVVCCLPNGQAGWTQASNVIDAPLTQVIRLPIITEWRASLTALGAETPVDAASVASESAIQLAVRPSASPLLAQPGATVRLEYAVENLGPEPVANVRLRGELADNLTFIRGRALGGDFTPPNDNAFEAVWPRLAPGEVVTIAVTAQVAEGLTAGTVLEQIVAVVGEDAAGEDSAAVAAAALIGLPPGGMPDFR